MDTQMTVDELFSIQVSRNGSTQVSRNGHVRQSLEQVISLPDSDLAKELPQPLRDGYEWFREKNRQGALRHFEALVLAVELDLPKQVVLYRQMLLDLQAKDQAERVAELIRQKFGYKGKRFEPSNPIPVPTSPVSSQKSFSLCLSTRRDGATQYYPVDWDFTPLREENSIVPLAGLQVLSFLAGEGIVPEGFFVAKPKPTPAPRRDPILFALFGPWLVALADWE